MPENEWKVGLRLDAIYYHSTLTNLELARKEYIPLQKVIKNIYDVDMKIKNIEAKYENPIDAYDEVEIFCIQLDSLYSEMSDKYKPVIERISLVHVLTSLCLEAYINLLGKEKLNPKSIFEYFDSLTIEGKWYLFPIIMRKNKTFDKGSEPFQSFIKLINYRNKLVHFKGKTDNWHSYLPPTFFEQLGLTIQQAEKSQKIAFEMIQLLCKYCAIDLPEWLKNKYWDIFESYF